jgi:IPT/TIG domain-containing protein
VTLPYPGRVRFAWGDMSAPEEVAVAPGGSPVLAAHTYRVPGGHTVVISTYDSQGRLNSLHVRSVFLRAGQAPAVLAVMPGSGPGGTSVSVIGAGLTGANAVVFGSQPATGLSVSSDNAVSCTTPAGAPGPVNVSVAAPGRGSGTLANGFTFTATEDPGEEARRR